MPIRTVADIEAFEAQPLAERALPRSTYEALAATASRTPDARALPLGKMFKPALQQLEMKSVVRAEAVRAGATIADLAHDRDGRGANVLRIRTHENAAALQSALDRYAFKSEVLGCDSGAFGKALGWQA